MWKSVLTIFSLIFAISLSGCFGGNSTPVPSDHYYRLTYKASDKSRSAEPILAGSLAVQRFVARGLYQERPLLFVKSENPLELRRHHYHHWTDTPSRLIQEDFLHYLRNTNFAQTISRFQPGQQSDYLITGRINRFERVLDSADTSVMVSLELELQSSRQKTIFRNIYTQSVDVSNREMHSSIGAFDTALQQIYSQFLQDIRGQFPR